MDWVAQLLGLDSSFHNAPGIGGGVIMGSASEACLTACIAARERALRLHPGTPFEKMVIVGTTQTHSLGAKAALILGLTFEAVETKAEDMWALRGSALKETLDRLKGEEKLPFALRESAVASVQSPADALSPQSLLWDLPRLVPWMRSPRSLLSVRGSISTSGALADRFRPSAADYPELFIHVE